MLRPAGPPTPIESSTPQDMVETLNEALVKTLPAPRQAGPGLRASWAMKRVLDATIALIHRPEITIEELMAIVPGPDFPTGGYIYGRAGIDSAYQTGRGIIKMRAKADIELDVKGDETAIIVSELPYQVNKARLLERIAELVLAHPHQHAS